MPRSGRGPAWILGNFLPYAFVGFVVGRGDVTRTSLVFGQENLRLGPFEPATATELDLRRLRPPTANRKAMCCCTAARLASVMDYALTSNIFLRGEFEYLRFLHLDDILVTMTSARVGAGFKF